MNEKKKNLDRFARWVAWKLPRRIVMWAAIRLIAHATQGPYSKTDVTSLEAMEALSRWKNEYRKPVI